ncbi:MAG: NUDIX domain-containing protein [Oscillospiraceae bacterium]
MQRALKGDWQSVLGIKVKVAVDKSAGMRQRIHSGQVHKLYYGYVGFITDDGGVQDVYILNFDGSVPAFDGIVCAVVERKNCERDKWVVIPEGTKIYEPEIWFSIQNQEEKFSPKLHCYFEKSCGSVIYTIQEGIKKYLLVENISGHIGFPKGHIEFAEDERQTAIREVYEEIHLRVSLDANFRSEYHHTLKNGAKKTDVYFSSKVFFPKSFSYQQEELLDTFLLPFNEAIKKLNRPQDMIVLLEHAEAFGK